MPESISQSRSKPALRARAAVNLLAETLAGDAADLGGGAAAVGQEGAGGQGGEDKDERQERAHGSGL